MESASNNNNDEQTPFINNNKIITINKSNKFYKETPISRFIESGLIVITAAIIALLVTNLNLCISLIGFLLNLITFFTCEPKETRAWTITKNATASQAAGKIHTDFEQ